MSAFSLSRLPDSLIETTPVICVLSCIYRRELTIRIVFRVARAYDNGWELVGGIQGRCRHARDLLAREGGGSVVRNRRVGAVIEPGAELRKSEEDAAIIDPGEADEEGQSAPPLIMRVEHIAGVNWPHGDAKVAVALRLPLRVTLGRLCKGVHRLGGRSHLGLMRRFELTDAQWEQIAPLLPPQKPRTGRPAEDHRQVLNGMLWILRTGAPWEDLPARYGPVGTVSSRFYRWRKAGVFDRVLQRLQAQADARGELDWDLHFVDATVVRAHQHAAGARRSGAIGG